MHVNHKMQDTIDLFATYGWSKEEGCDTPTEFNVEDMYQIWSKHRNALDYVRIYGSGDVEFVNTDDSYYFSHVELNLVEQILNGELSCEAA